MPSQPQPILVGVDGSEPSLLACQWAADEARLRDRPLRLVYAYIGPGLAVPMMVPPYDWLPEQLRAEGEDILAKAASVVRDQAPQVALSNEVTPGAPGHVLVEESRTADLVVVGHRGHGGFASLLLGSVASTVAAHALAPVVVVRATTDTAASTAARTAAGTGGKPAPVVVGVDGPERSEAALRFGFEEARLRGVPVHAVHAYLPPPPPWRADLRYDPAEVETAERHRLGEWVEPVRQHYPEVPVELRVLAGHPAGALVEAGRTATLLVIGSRGRGGFTGLLLGSVSQQVIRHAEGPVAVTR